jgi:hypothetical protein
MDETEKQNRRKFDTGSRTELLAILEQEFSDKSKSQSTIEMIYQELVLVRALQEHNAAELEKVTEILEAWNNAKGFVKTSMMIVRVAKWFLFAAGTTAGVYYWLTGRGHI